MIFTKTDKALLDRAARILHDQAMIESNMHGPVWSATVEGKGAKRRYDRLLRDERDLRALGKRLEVNLGGQKANDVKTPGEGLEKAQTGANHLSVLSSQAAGIVTGQQPGFSVGAGATAFPGQLTTIGVTKP